MVIRPNAVDLVAAQDSTAAMRPLLVMLLASFVALVGCAHGDRRPNASSNPAPFSNFSPTGQKLILTPETGLTGKVSRVNPDGRFVVMIFPVGHLPALEQRLYVYRLGLKTGEIKVSGPQLDDKIVGDVVAGEVRPGDEVRDR